MTPPCSTADGDASGNQSQPLDVTHDGPTVNRSGAERRDWDDVTEVDLSVQHLVGPYPTLHAIGLGPQLAELERICAESQRGKHVGKSILDYHSHRHIGHAENHLYSNGRELRLGRDPESNARHLIHAAARLLMAAACADAEGRP